MQSEKQGYSTTRQSVSYALVQIAAKPSGRDRHLLRHAQLNYIKKLQSAKK
jgi:hypothetical protein